MTTCRFCGQPMPDDDDLFSICDKCAEHGRVDGETDSRWARPRLIMFPRLWAIRQGESNENS